MPTYFADAWFFIALVDRRDSHHAQARRLAFNILDSPVVTHDYVLSEMLAHFADDGVFSRELAVKTVRDALRNFDVVHGDRALFLKGIDRYGSRLDKEYSLVDCMSMVLMEERGIQHVLTNDHHFTQAGFTVVNQ